MTHCYVWHDSFLMRDTTHLYVWHVSVVCVTWLIRMCDLTLSYVWPDSFVCVTWLIHLCDMCDMTSQCVQCDTLVRVALLLRMCAITHPYESWLISMRDAWCDAFDFVFVTSLLRMCAMTHSNVTWHIHKCNTTQSYLWSHFFTRMPWLITKWHDTFTRNMSHWYLWHSLCVCVPWLIHTCDTTHSNMYVETTLPRTCTIPCTCGITQEYVWCRTYTSEWIVTLCTCTEPHFYVTRHIHMCDMSDLYLWRHFLVHVPWLIPTWHDIFTCVKWLIR